MKRSRLKISKPLLECLNILEKDFEILPAELLRVGSLDSLKLHPITRLPGEGAVLELAWPASLHKRLQAHARAIGCPLPTVVENLLWQTVRGFPDQWRGPLQENAEGRKRLFDALDQAGWW